MTDSTPISPPSAINTATPSSTSTTDVPAPISPVSKTGSFPHKTSAVVGTSRPFIETSTPAINQTPVELDGVPTSPQDVKRKGDKGEKLVSPGLGEEEDIAEEFLGEGGEGAGRVLREKRAAILASRSKDPGVIVDVPKDPTAEEVEAAKSAEGTLTPGLPPPNAKET